MIKLTVNGKEEGLPQPTPLLSYLESLGVNLRRIAVAYNGVVVRRDGLAEVTLSDGDSLEIVHAVGGGADPCQESSRVHMVM